MKKSDWAATFAVISAFMAGVALDVADDGKQLVLVPLLLALLATLVRVHWAQDVRHAKVAGEVAGLRRGAEVARVLEKAGKLAAAHSIPYDEALEAVRACDAVAATERKQNKLGGARNS